ncbi:spore cortex biosynthesis protein YabQ [Clostridium algidicarnis]|uniref:Spore cortex biosynthesis protein YabQ n=2 Tax=Clostridium algidicarnis TaxID=37659 RepID=A0A2S6FZ12_9CLOT|nr:spore cortex biosynthesis protein YabQ [Clostridium algidicarnis]MBB6630129.1 spore cortex biosynthesis protein YabQ [Clostridium algidicarnis]MBB6696867.1 spore cortex biosynthesis protein YabQ [Clostridium algidicarnis]MBU3193216.1 spore cortex biosynthesis protein YabQ [Clostridium algidicarnis]MBU3204572.1 spore cortex biosynthesis protein YabQ [Clostridium algidicarnis]MBU3206526.1 spore cortex biosynthesis protein YabQ [Clostridium algidicarnis]
MIIPLLFQFKTILFSILSGIITGILFDFYRIIRGHNKNKVLAVFQDLLFWILASIIVFVFLLYTNYALIVPYVYLYIALGIYIYLKLLSKYILKVQYAIYRFIAKVFRVGFNHVFYPLKLIFYNKSKK